MDFDVSRATVEELLAYFASEALGLTLGARIHDDGDLSARHRAFLTKSESKSRVWVAWHTDKGPLSTFATYDREQAIRIGAHVLRIEWWVAPGEHYDGWWHCYPNRRREWIKGAGLHRNPRP